MRGYAFSIVDSSTCLAPAVVHKYVSLMDRD